MQFLSFVKLLMLLKIAILSAQLLRLNFICRDIGGSVLMTPCALRQSAQVGRKTEALAITEWQRS
ncbi:MAG: hypothetical protein CMD92_03025 [Gammaproteobacteria bacterium]|nr:hypothetical protein [Gammaproteobacteria bacterium]